jgi:alanyl-tRNA synthetase
LQNTEAAKAFAIVEESGVSKGVRRVVGVTGGKAEGAKLRAREIELLAAEAKKAPDDKLHEMQGKISAALAAGEGLLPLGAKRLGQGVLADIHARLKAAEKAAKAAGAGLDVGAEAEKLLATAVDLSVGKMVVAEVPGASDEELRSIIDSVKKRQASYGVVLVTAAGEDKVTIISGVSDDLIAKGLKAGEWAGEVAKVVGGRGGGRPNLAQAGGKEPGKISQALETARQWAKGKVTS